MFIICEAFFFFSFFLLILFTYVSELSFCNNKKSTLDPMEQEIQEASADYLRLQELYQQREALEDELAHLYAVWERLAADLEEARG